MLSLNLFLLPLLLVLSIFFHLDFVFVMLMSEPLELEFIQYPGRCALKAFYMCMFGPPQGEAITWWSCVARQHSLLFTEVRLSMLMKKVCDALNQTLDVLFSH